MKTYDPLNKDFESLSKEELLKQCKFLENERNKRLKADITVADAHKLVESENTRIKSIQSFIGEALKIDNKLELHELTIETIIESFECENALFLLHKEENTYEVVYDFSATFAEAFIELHQSITDSNIFLDNTELFKAPSFLNKSNFILAAADENNNTLLLAYNTSTAYERLKNEHLNSFSIIAHQIGTILQNLKTKHEIEELSKQLEHKVEIRTQELHEQQKFVQTILDSQEQLILTTNGEKIVTANQTFLDFFTVDTIEEFMQTYNARCICDTFNKNAPEGYLQIKMGEDERESWIDYVISRSHGHNHKAMITIGEINFIFSVNAAKLPLSNGLKSAVFTNITEMENAKVELEQIHKHTKESIEYASLIQTALIPENIAFKNYFSDYFAIWQPKDIVGGDIYLMNQINEDELVLMVIDCTGHGVPGAFVTMLVKAIERQIMVNIHKDETISPAKILSIFNKSIKKLLKQEDIDSVSNAGFDGGVIYYNKKEKTLKFSGAETALFYIEDNILKTIKGSRHSVGYKKSDANFEFKEHELKVKEGMQFYCTTDGYLDQNGGEKGFPFGKRKFGKLITDNQHQMFSSQKEILLNTIAEYQGNEERNDDVTIVGFEI